MLTVTNLNDTGVGSLRQAILDHTSMPGDDTITFAPGLTGTINQLSGGTQLLAGNINLKGPGAGIITVKNSYFKVIDSAYVSVDGLTFSSGKGFYLESGRLTVSHCTFTDNTQVFFNNGSNEGSVLTVTNCSIVNNSGDAIYLAGGGIVTLKNTTIANNVGVGLYAPNQATSTVSECIIANNHQGGIKNVLKSAMTIDRSTIVSNQILQGAGGDWNGAGIYNSGLLNLSNSTVAFNQAHSFGKDNGNGQGIQFYDGKGGGIYNVGTMAINNCTIADNTAESGGAIYNWGGTTAVTNSTIAGNTAKSGSGGIFNLAGTVVVYDTIIAGNHVDATYGADVAYAFISLGHNLVGDGLGSSGFTASGDQVGYTTAPLDPRLGPLQDNGGPTQTMALLKGSPAINAGDSSGATATDQRGPGFPRVVGGTIDIGAVESTASLPPPSVSLAFGPAGEVVDAVSSDGTLTQYDASGAHVLGGGVRTFSLAFGPSGAMMEVVSLAGVLTQITASGAQTLATGVLSASVVFGPAGMVVDIVTLDGVLTQFDVFGAHMLGGGVVSASLAFGPTGPLLEVVTQAGTLIQIDTNGSQQLGAAGSVRSAGLTFAPFGRILIVMLQDGSLYQFDWTGSRLLGMVS